MYSEGRGPPPPPPPGAKSPRPLAPVRPCARFPPWPRAAVPTRVFGPPPSTELTTITYARFIVCATRSTTTAVAPRAPFQHAAMAMCSTSRPLRDAATKGVQTPVPADAASVGTPSQQTKSSSWAPRPGSRARSIPRARPDVRHLCDVDALAARRAGSNLLLSARSRRPRARVRRRGTPCDSVDPARHHRRSAPHRFSSAPGRCTALALVRLLCSARHDPRSASPRRTPPARHGQCEAAPGTSLHSAILRAHRQRAWTESRMCAAVNGCGPDRPPRLPPTQCGGGHRIPSHGRRADRHSRRAPSLRHVLTHRAAAAALRRGQGSRRSASRRAAPPRAAPRTPRASRRAHRRGQVV